MSHTTSKPTPLTTVGDRPPRWEDHSCADVEAELTNRTAHGQADDHGGLSQPGRPQNT